MQLKHVDTYRYTGKKRIRYSNTKGEMELSPGSFFYYVTFDRPGDYVSLTPKGPYFKLSEKSFDKLSELAEEYVTNTTTQSLNLLIKKKVYVIETLSKILTEAIPSTAKVQLVDTLTKTSGLLETYAVINDITYKFTFSIDSKPFFCITIWIPRSVNKELNDLPNWARRLPTKLDTVRQTIFPKLKLPITAVQKGKTIIHIPTKKFDGVIYRWLTFLD